MTEQTATSTLTTEKNIENKMRILWHSNAPWAPTGYGVQTSLIVPRLSEAGYPMGLSAFYGLEGGISRWVNNIPIYPKGSTAYGTDVIGLYSAAFKADIAITLIDAWVMNQQMMGTSGTKWIPYYPIDASPVPIAVFRQINQAFDRIVMSRFGERQTNNAGLSCHYAPHGIDTKEIYFPMDQVKCKEELSKAVGFDKDSFLIGMVAANNGLPARKAFEPQLRAFAQFKQKHPDAQMYIHAYTNDRNEIMGDNLPEIIRFLGLTLGRDVFLPDPAGYKLGYGYEFMRKMYSAMDVHTLVSMGEGFGIPIVEAQACGCPVIVGDWTAMSELCFSGWKVPESEAELFYQPVGAYQYYPRVGAIVDAYEQAYEMRGNQDYRRRARDGAIAYNIDKVVEKYWLPALAKIQQRVEESK